MLRSIIPDPRRTAYTGLFLTLLVTVLAYATDWDRSLAGYFYRGGVWYGQSSGLAMAAYRYGTYPALFAGFLGALAFLASYRRERWRAWRGPGLYLFLLLALGPGLLINTLGKGLAGRPRPEQVVEFGGFWEFLRPFQFGIPGRGQSFPSGHASMGFFWLALFFLAQRRGSRLLGLGLGLSAGLLMSWTRVAQGGHFLSDTLIAGTLIFTLAAVLSPLIHWQPAPAFWWKPRVRGALIVGLLAVLALGHVVYEERHLLWQRPSALGRLATQRVQTWPYGSPPDKLALDLQLQNGAVTVTLSGSDDGISLPFSVTEILWGASAPGAKAELNLDGLQEDRYFRLSAMSLGVRVRQSLRGLWFGVNASYDVILPLHLTTDARLSVERGSLTIAQLPAGRQVLLMGDLHHDNLPRDFHPYGNDAWLREGDLPQIALTLRAPEIHFEP